ncbi:XdhC family protein, partial [Aliarcobacter butzleri]
MRATSLLSALEAFTATQQGYVIATVVKTQGSAYRQVGARMLISSTGESWGTISGGCLEA